MSIVKNNIKINNNSNYLQRLAIINQIGDNIFHTKDLANLWQIKNPGNLHTTLSRYVKNGLLFRIYRGFYSTLPLDKINPKLLGLKSLHEFSYVSTETVLAEAGIILQIIKPITLVSSKSKKFSINNNYYASRKLAPQYLFNSEGIQEIAGIRTAKLNRAIADLLYFNPNFHFDAKQQINWQAVKKIQVAIGYPLTPNCYDFTKPKRS